MTAATKSNAKRQMLVTAALIYANGSVHLGHLVEYIQADIWARFQRLQGNHCLYICGSDAHGTPIMLSAKKEGITPEALIEKHYKTQAQDFNDFYISFDNFHSTHSDENRQLSAELYQRLHARGDINKKTIRQAFDEQENIFLPDRFIRGECPRCHAKDQYGDNCEVCSATYSPVELINAKSAFSGTTPIEKDSEHFFFNLENYREMLEHWIQDGHLQANVANKLKEWFTEGELRPWDISRDAPYFGFEIPDAPGKYFYVWLDAPVGYMASLKNLCDQRDDIQFDDYWKENSDIEVHHFIGKDIIYFHALFWPAMLKGSNHRLPNNIFVHGYLTIDGKKMSKSRGTFITARKYLDHLNPEYLRYYYATKLTPHVEDIDLNLTDFSLRINSDLVGKYVNLASRCAGFITKKFDGMLADQLPEPDLFNQFINAGESILTCFESLNYNKAVREIMTLADHANQYIDQQKPWALAKEPGNEETIQAVCTQGLNLFKVLTTYLKPILPATAEKVEGFLNCDELTFANMASPLLSHKINKFKPLMQRVPPEAIEAITPSETT